MLKPVTGITKSIASNHTTDIAISLNAMELETATTMNQDPKPGSNQDQ